MRRRHDSFPGTKGFTLLELLLVIVILSAGAWMLMSTAGDGIAQARYDDTRNRLEAIRGVILGPTGPAALERGLLSGYVVDNGVLPENIDALVTTPKGTGSSSDYDAFDAVAPRFSPTSQIASNSDTDLDDHRLMKGHRGAYLPASPHLKSKAPTFRDGWGTINSENTTDDANNHGWRLTPANPNTDPEIPFQVESLGMDGAEGETTANAYEADMSMSPPILRDDWSVNVSTRTVSVRNYDTTNPIGNLRASLLIFENTTEGGQWRRLSTDPAITVPAADSVVGYSDATASFPSNSYVPIGEHLLVLVSDPDGSEFTSDDALHGTSPNHIAKRVKFYPRCGVPDMVLEIR